MKRRKFIEKSMLGAALKPFGAISAFNTGSNHVLSKPTTSPPVATLSTKAPVIISVTQDHFMRDGRYFFYLADTVWSAFTNPSFEEWEYYLEYRRSQGFNALQINILPQGDRSKSATDDPMPFQRTTNGQQDFSRPNLAYFERAAKLTAMAVEKGFVPALVLLWANFVPGTWVNTHYKTQAMKKEQIKPYVKMVVDQFGKFNPIWIVSGDADLSQEGKVWFKIARDYLKELTPDLLCTFHLDSKAALPEEWTDIYLTYTGHGIDNETAAYKQAIDRSGRKIKHPVLNGEPCYEAHGSGPNFRFNAFDLRRQAWWSLLSGAKAGIAYGGHGVWCWHRIGQRFGNEQWAQMPLDWRNALKLPGAWDMSFAKDLFEQYHLYELNPRQDLLDVPTEHVRLSANDTATVIAIYVPYVRDIKIRLDLSTYDVQAINLSQKQYEHPAIESHAGLSVIRMSESNSDVLIIAKQRA